jgi:hypothetical protein
MIAELLLPPLPQSRLQLPASFTDLPPEDAISDFHSFRRSSARLFHLDLPSRMWSYLVMASCHRMVFSLHKRSLYCSYQYHSYPGHGLERRQNVWKGLHRDFKHPLEAALDVSERFSQQSEPEDGAISARDVWYWWTYDPGWRSRRRVWWAIVDGVRTAREADWWCSPPVYGQ